jgi:predicted enzyme related to lactoylglutathione lyase
VILKGAGLPGGMLRNPKKDVENGDVKVFFWVPDIAAFLRPATQLGAEVLLAESRVPAAPTLAEFRDPDGNIIGIIYEDVPRS